MSNPDGATLPAAFTGTYDCGTGYTGVFSVAAGASPNDQRHPDRQHLLRRRDRPGPDPRLHLGPDHLHPCLDRDQRPRVKPSRSWSATRSPATVATSRSPRPRATRTGRPCRLPSRAPMTAAPATPASSAWLHGASQTISGIPTGNTCSVVETAPAPIPGYTWGPITYTPATIVISTKGGTFEIVVGNSITRDRGNFKITKTTSNPDGATLPAAFTGTYDCGTGYTGVFSVAAWRLARRSAASRPATPAPSSRPHRLRSRVTPGVRSPTPQPRL